MLLPQESSYSMSVRVRTGRWIHTGHHGGAGRGGYPDQGGTVIRINTPKLSGRRELAIPLNLRVKLIINISV